MDASNDEQKWDPGRNTMKTVRVEHDLLLRVARLDLDEIKKGELTQLQKKQIDWEYLISTARQHGLIPLLHRHLSSSLAEIPTAQLERIRQESIENSQAVLHLIGRLRELLKVFNEEHLPALIFKGPVLSEIAYGENSLRQAGDLDILVQVENFNDAKRLLESLGYEMTPPLTSTQQAAHLGFHCEIQFMRDNRFTVVDLHWSLTPKAFPFVLNPEEWIARGQQVSFAGVPLRTFGLEDLILFQSMHGAKHYWSRLEWISSLAEIIRSHSQIDWVALINRARSARGVRILALGLHLAQRVGDVEIPQPVLSEIDADGAMKKIAEERLAELFIPQRSEYRSVRAIRDNLKIMDRKRDVMASMLNAVFVPTISDWQTLTLPNSLYLFYYVLRPFRLGVTYAVAAWQTFVSRTGFQTNAASKIR